MAKCIRHAVAKGSIEKVKIEGRFVKLFKAVDEKNSEEERRIMAKDLESIRYPCPRRTNQTIRR